LFSFDDGLPGFLVPGSIEWRMTLHFYSDNNSAMRRSVWEKLPYPEVDWGEDQIWCWEMLKLGMTKAYADKAVVWHSHDLGEAEHIKVAASEGHMFARYFGYDLTNGVFGKAEFEAARSQALLYATEAGIPLHQAEAYARMTAWSHKGRSHGTALAQFDD
jgi:O-antigen biosynthesis protein